MYLVIRLPDRIEVGSELWYVWWIFEILIGDKVATTVCLIWKVSFECRFGKLIERSEWLFEVATLINIQLYFNIHIKIMNINE